MTQTQLLELIEEICSNSDTEEVDMMESRLIRTTELERRLKDSLNSIYRAVHSHRKNKVCKHPEWQEEAEKAYQSLIK